MSEVINEKEHRNIYITGNVQGVNFRASAQRLAEGLGLTGYARNQPDGSVLIEIEGEPTSVQEFTLWCQDGPRRAHVTAIQSETAGLQHFTDFTIR